MDSGITCTCERPTDPYRVDVRLLVAGKVLILCWCAECDRVYSKMAPCGWGIRDPNRLLLGRLI